VRSLPGVAQGAKPGQLPRATPGKPAFAAVRKFQIPATTRIDLSREGRRYMFGPVIVSVLYVFNTLIDLYELVIIVAVVASWLIVFGVLSTRNQFARSLINALDALTEPVFRQVRRVIPSFGGIDFSPIIVFIVLEVVRRLVNGYAVMSYG
jgi:YggT family protein